MNPTIQLTFRYSERDYVLAARAHLATRTRLFLDIPLVFILAGVGAYLWRSPAHHWVGVISVLISVIFSLILVLGFIVIPQIAFRREPKFRDEYSLSFSPEEIHFQTKSIDSKIQWSFYAWALIDPHSYLLCHGTNSFTVIPKRAFQDVDQRRAFELLLEECIPKLVRKGN